jgi:hypothetical protein
MTVSSGISGSGSDATGWTDGGWTGGNDSRFSIIDPVSDLTKQISGGAFLDGGTRALELNTSPEPDPSGLEAYRSFSGQNTTLYASFLVQLLSIGTGSDSLEFFFGSGSTIRAGVAFQPTQGQTSMLISPFTGAFSGGLVPSVQLNQTYLIVVSFERPTLSNFNLHLWVDPPASYPGTSGYGINSSISTSALISAVGFAIVSTDTGGPTSSISVDELRVGYTWNDVVPYAVPEPNTLSLILFCIAFSIVLNRHRRIGEGSSTF